MKQYAFVVELGRCIGCMQCETACEMEGSSLLDASRIHVCQVLPDSGGASQERYFLPVMCQQCANPACVYVCPSASLTKDPEDGIIRFDPFTCIGCLECAKACPYHALNTSQDKPRVDKCTLCMQAVQKGEVPPCVTACAGEALAIGNISDPDSEVSRRLTRAGGSAVFTLPNRRDCQPSTRYILSESEWQDRLPEDLLRGSRTLPADTPEDCSKASPAGS
ncbi:MAG: 4Fe-4S dicluster domain-containing protein [Eubacterium sp.]|jgi:Fe-S-cluster-containing dehydrogenase component